MDYKYIILRLRKYMIKNVFNLIRETNDEYNVGYEDAVMDMINFIDKQEGEKENEKE